MCPDCPTLISLDNKEVEKTVKLGLEKFNKESGLPNYFAPLNITRAISQVRTCPKIRKDIFKNKVRMMERMKLCISSDVFCFCFCLGCFDHYVQCGVHHSGDSLL